MKKVALMIFTMLMFLTSASVISAAPAQQADTKTINKYLNEFKNYRAELEVTENEPYKEVRLPDGTILFNEIKINKNVNGEEKSLSTMGAQAQETYSMTSSQGAKNIVGLTLYKLDYTTTWTFDYDKVISSNSYVAVHNGVGWSLKGTNSYGPVINNSGREHEWTGTGYFAMIVAGIDIDNETLINHHRVRYDGTYAWKYEVVD